MAVERKDGKVSTTQQNMNARECAHVLRLWYS